MHLLQISKTEKVEWNKVGERGGTKQVWVDYYWVKSVFPGVGTGWDGINEGSLAAIPVASLH